MRRSRRVALRDGRRRDGQRWSPGRMVSALDDNGERRALSAALIHGGVYHVAGGACVNHVHTYLDQLDSWWHCYDTSDGKMRLTALPLVAQSGDQRANLIQCAIGNFFEKLTDNVVTPERMQTNICFIL
jgi:hypothetical protein